MNIINQNQLINIINCEKTTFLLGAGASCSSGCMLASQLVYEFKKRIYCVENNVNIENFKVLTSDKKQLLDEYFKDEKCENEYSYYFEKCFNTAVSRMQFIKNQFGDIKPSIGYLCLAEYLITNKSNIIYTTNFDNLIKKAVFTLDSDYDCVDLTESLVPKTSNSLSIVKLHGDYDYTLQRNTSSETSALSANMKQAILSCQTKNLIVIGYSGADKSVMNALNRFVETNPNKSIIWCSISEVVGENVKDLMNKANKINPDSSIAIIKDFDTLFLKNHAVYGKKNDLIDVKINKNYPLIFSNNFPIENIEKIKFNTFKCLCFPKVYKILGIQSSKQLYDEIREIGICQFHGGDLFFVGELDRLKEILKFENIEIVELNNDINYQTFAKKLIKDIIDFGLLDNNSIKRYKNKFYFENSLSNGLYKAFSYNLVHIMGELYITYSLEYVCLLTDDVKSKFKVNFAKSKLRNKEYLECLQGILKDRDFFKFEFGSACIEFSNEWLTQRDLELPKLDEPILRTNSEKVDISPIKIISEDKAVLPQIHIGRIKLGIFCVQEYKQKLLSYLDNLSKHIKQFDEKDKVIPEYLGFKNIFNCEVEIIDELPCFSIHQLRKLSIEDYVNFCVRGIQKLCQKGTDINIIFFPDELNGISKDIKTGTDFHDLLKCKCANKYITQVIHASSIHSSDSLLKKIWNLAIALYTKVVNIPWVPYAVSTDTAFVGIGYGINSNGVTVGCSQIFDSFGRGLELILKEVSANSENPFLTHDEAFEVGNSLKDLYYRAHTTNVLKNIVIHKTTEFKKWEIEGLVKSFSNVENIDLLQIVENCSIKAIKMYNDNYATGFPISRGTFTRISDNEFLIWTHGSVRKEGFNGGADYYKGGKGIPSPLLIRRYYGKTPIDILAKQIMMLTKMDYNSADVLYSNLPVTLKYTEKVSNILKQGNINEKFVDFRYVI